MSGVLSQLGLTPERVKALATVPVKAGSRRTEAGGRKAESNSAIRTPQSALAVGGVIPVNAPQVAPVLSDEDVKRIAKGVAEYLKPWMKKPRRQVLAKARAEQTVYASAERQSRIPDHLRPLARVCAEAFGLTFEAMERPGRTPNQSAAKFLLRWAMVWPCGHTTSAADLLLGLSGGTCSKSAYRAIEMSQDKSDPLSGKMLLGMARVKEFLGVREEGGER